MTLSFFHYYIPSPIIISVGPFNIYWYGFLYAVAIVLAYWLTAWNLKKVTTTDESRAALIRHDLVDLAFGVILAGLIGARLYHVTNEFAYYLAVPGKILAIWEGGLAIHGAFIGGALYMWWYARKRNIPFLWLADLIAPAVLLGQAIGRFGNYFNQELFGYPTSLLWGIPIDIFHRPAAYINSEYFHPAFLYESLWDVLALIALLVIARKKNLKPGTILFLYLIFTSVGRIIAELFRVDQTPMLGPIRLPLLIAAGIIIFATSMLFRLRKVY